MISTHENLGGSNMSLAELEKLAGVFAFDYQAVKSIVSDMEAELNKVKARYLRALRQAVAKAQTSKSVLQAAVQNNDGLFEKPRTQVFHGIKIGFRKGTGGIDWDDDAKVVELIEKHFPKAQAELLIKTTKKPITGALADLDVAELKKIGCRVESTGDIVVVKPMDGEVEKVVAALLKSETEVAS